MQHSFNVELACKVGLEKATLLHNIVFWRQKDRANNHNFNDGKHWVYNSAKAFSEIMPYLNHKSVTRRLKELVDDGYLFSGCYNKSKFDKTLWYSPTQTSVTYYDLSIAQNESSTNQDELSGDQFEVTIPVSNPVSNPSIEKPISKISSNEETTPNGVEVATHGKENINVLLNHFKDCCQKAGLQYMPGKMEREFAKHILSKKMAEEVSKYNMPLDTFIENIIKLSAQPYMKQVNTPQLFYQNWGMVLNAGKLKLETQEEGKRPIYNLNF